MRARSATVAGVLSLATAVNAVGKAIINNNCNHDVYLWPVSVDESPSSATVIKANGGTWSQQYKTCSTGGMSLKLSDNDDLSTGITQFEYTLDPDKIWYDISNVNCLPFGTGLCPFQNTGMHLSSGSSCPTAKCKAGADTCAEAYTKPKDDWASLSCLPSEDTTLELCTSGASSSSGSGSGSSDSGKGIIGQVTSIVGNLLGGGASTPTTSSTPPPAPTTSTTPTTSAAPAPSTPSSKAQAWSPPANAPGGAYNNHGAVGIAAVPTTWSSAAAAPSPSTTSTTEAPPSPKPQTTLITTKAPAEPNVAVVYETVTEMVATTTVVYQHKMAHKAKRDSTHPHARRHHHDA